MYIASSRSDKPSTVGTARELVARNVIALGAVSLITDVSSEMVSAVLPLYLVIGLGLSPLQFGFLDGMYSGVTAMVRLAGGYLADRWRRLKTVAGFGYALSAVCKLGLLAAGSSPVALGAVLAADRTGKGVRTAPRDALISLSSKPETLGRSFGVHRAMDTVGAFLGPLVAMLVLWAAVGRYDAVFFVSFCIASLGVLALVLLVRDERPPVVTDRALRLRAALNLLRMREFRRVCLCAAMLGLVTISDSFLYLLLQRRWDVAAVYFPLLPLGTAGAYLLLAMPLGQLADRVGRLQMFLAGHVALLGALLVVGVVAGGPLLAVLALGLHGVFYAATDGVLMAAAGPLLPARQRASGMAVLQTGQAAARSFSSVLFGAAWTAWGPQPALIVAGCGLLVVTVGSGIVKPLGYKA